MPVLVVPICGYCAHYKKDDDFQELFGTCEFKPNYVAFRSTACRKWEMRVGLETVKSVNMEFIS